MKREKVPENNALRAASSQSQQLAADGRGTKKKMKQNCDDFGDNGRELIKVLNFAHSFPSS